MSVAGAGAVVVGVAGVGLVSVVVGLLQALITIEAAKATRAILTYWFVFIGRYLKLIVSSHLNCELNDN
jgi:hypothetical protein